MPLRKIAASLAENSGFSCAWVSAVFIHCDKCRALARQESDIPTGLARELEMSEENPFEEERAWRSMALPGKYLYNQIRA